MNYHDDSINTASVRCSGRRAPLFLPPDSSPPPAAQLLLCFAIVLHCCPIYTAASVPMLVRLKRHSFGDIFQTLKRQSLGMSISMPSHLINVKHI